jgi:hypothetical protein
MWSFGRIRQKIVVNGHHLKSPRIVDASVIDA